MFPISRRRSDRPPRCPRGRPQRTSEGSRSPGLIVKEAASAALDHAWRPTVAGDRLRPTFWKPHRLSSNVVGLGEHRYARHLGLTGLGLEAEGSVPLTRTCIGYLYGPASVRKSSLTSTWRSTDAVVGTRLQITEAAAAISVPVVVLLIGNSFNRDSTLGGEPMAQSGAHQDPSRVLSGGRAKAQ